MQPFENHDKALIRAGRYVRQPTGYKAFMPAPLPPEPPVQLARLRLKETGADTLTEWLPIINSASGY